MRAIVCPNVFLGSDYFVVRYPSASSIWHEKLLNSCYLRLKLLLLTGMYNAIKKNQVIPFVDFFHVSLMAIFWKAPKTIREHVSNSSFFFLYIFIKRNLSSQIDNSSLTVKHCDINQTGTTNRDVIENTFCSFKKLNVLIIKNKLNIRWLI